MAGLNPIALGLAPPFSQPGGPALAVLPRRNVAQENTVLLPGNADEDSANAGVIVSISEEGLTASRQLGQSGEAALSENDRREVERLEARDREVRAHEQAHVSAGGQYVQGGPRYEFTRGPDGRQYATGGEVSIDVSPESTPEATIQKARVVRRAALAPAEPSAQDRRIAAQASQLEANARQELRKRAVEANADVGNATASLNGRAVANALEGARPNAAPQLDRLDAPSPSGIDILA